ncbi:hypothetical protein L6452_42287 [Arctium lappa]|uniref:Uncharacterized protein n=1 Tax=Arctium lappa TaxID=4217 RepID=A0ACB8XHU9_ARCLA|nr:hypothetical protein L6452_42287 [Arctium lappa]
MLILQNHLSLCSRCHSSGVDSLLLSVNFTNFLDVEAMDQMQLFWSIYLLHLLFSKMVLTSYASTISTHFVILIVCEKLVPEKEATTLLIRHLPEARLVSIEGTK